MVTGAAKNVGRFVEVTSGGGVVMGSGVGTCGGLVVRWGCGLRFGLGGCDDPGFAVVWRGVAAPAVEPGWLPSAADPPG